MSMESPQSVLNTLATEEIVKQVAPQLPYSIKLSEEDIDLAIRELAAREIRSGESEGSEKPAPITEGEFQRWYEQKLETIPLSESEYRDFISRSLLRFGMNQYLADRIPTVAEQVRLQVITLRSAEDAELVVERLESGEDFMEVAGELKADELLVVREVDLGWRPRGAMTASFVRVAFEELEIGEHSDPIVVDGRYYGIIKLVDRAKAREVDEEILQVLRSNAFERWLQQELPYHAIAVHGLNNGFDAETEAWVRWKLQNM
jgi:parvulin-like peptidyl-prolyl isomerase